MKNSVKEECNIAKKSCLLAPPSEKYCLDCKWFQQILEKENKKEGTHGNN